MEFLLDIIKSIAPAIVVFVTVYYMLQQYLAQERFKMNSTQFQNNKEQILPLRLQAYERLSLFLERARVTNLILRFPKGEMNYSQWISTLMLAIQQEYEHNMVQQIYVSDPLWNIISLTKDEIFQSLNEIAHLYEQNPEDSIAIQKSIEHSQQYITTALSAIKQEVKLILHV